MARLFLLRHARAHWPRPGTADFDRPLSPDGVKEATSMAAMMVASGFAPQAVLCSTARRCRQTWELMAESFEDCPVDYLAELYQANPAGYLETIRLFGQGNALLVVGHNPMIEELAMALTADRDGSVPAALAGGFPTCGLAVVGLDCALADICPARGRLEAFVTPRALAG
jgi:phosphohistidine phosphatase